ncbi:PREDICTED: deoxycytidylate deaminase-like [Priapulus caudatus]|uniref:dCMP deaminase n=1 Tax=Priapulus caudatus TaxID=37621 RepID=A0ABM1F9N4_PRICU|nr:PREDICTED: deoxycytidylate deaminase-like [Priapulus caudatus]
MDLGNRRVNGHITSDVLETTVNKFSKLSTETDVECKTASSSVASNKISSESTSRTRKQYPRKRTEYIEWPDYFMAVAFLSAQRSKDPSTQVGACIVNPDNKIVGIGYNGMPNGCPDDDLPWGKDSEDWLDRKYPYVCHAEMNAIMNKNSADVKGCTMYVAMFPCNECAKLIIQAGIRDVVYYSDKNRCKPEYVASQRLFTMTGVTVRQYKPSRNRIVIDFSDIDAQCMAAVHQEVDGRDNNDVS